MRVLLKFGVAAALIFAASCKQRDVTSVKDDEEIGADDPRAPKGSFPTWAYDPGPFPGEEIASKLTNPYPTQLTNVDGNQVNLVSPMGKDLIDLYSRIPYFAGLSNALYGHQRYGQSTRPETQMFRFPYGPIPWRMTQAPNSIKILFIGQDGTHIAEAAGRPATAGFGGRAQDLAAYFGVGSSAAFINAYAFTIRWQYGVFDAPVVMTRNGQKELVQTSFVPNPVWMISQDPDSPMVQWRNELISWIIRNNSESLRMIVLFGGAARDTMATFVNAKGGKVGTRYSEEELAGIQVPQFEFADAGGNKQAAFPVDANGKDLYRELNQGQTPSYDDPAAMKTLQAKARTAYKTNAAWRNKLVVKASGKNGSGMIHEGQLGYDINRKMSINGENTISLKGLVVDGVELRNDVLVTQLPHPTALSMMDGDAASEAVAKGLEQVKVFRDQRGWTIPKDPGNFTNSFQAGQPYKYRRGDMGTEYYDFGAPNSRMVNVSSATRSGKETIIFGARSGSGFPDATLSAMKAATPCHLVNNECGTPPAAEMWITRPNKKNIEDRFFKFDPGPGLEWAKVLKTSLPNDPAFHKARDVNGDFAHYRGTFKNPKVVILADPHGYDDLITARALTGARGQNLHGMMEDLGIGDEYLVIKTAPYSQDNMWDATLAATRDYRVKVLGKLFAETQPVLILTDGASAKAELEAIKATLPTPPSAPIVSIERPSNNAQGGLQDAFDQIKRTVPAFAEKTFSNRMVDIPRSHMTYYARVWEGTSGDRVITSNSAAQNGKIFAEVAPRWAFNQKYTMSEDEVNGCKAQVTKLNNGKLRMGGETVAKYVQRYDAGTPGRNKCAPVVAEGEGSGPGGVIAQLDEAVKLLDDKLPEASGLVHVDYDAREDLEMFSPAEGAQ